MPRKAHAFRGIFYRFYRYRIKITVPASDTRGRFKIIIKVEGALKSFYASQRFCSYGRSLSCGAFTTLSVGSQSSPVLERIRLFK